MFAKTIIWEFHGFDVFWRIDANSVCFQVRNHLWVFINCLIENPAFDSQTKEMLGRFLETDQHARTFVKRVLF